MRNRKKRMSAPKEPDILQDPMEEANIPEYPAEEASKEANILEYPAEEATDVQEEDPNNPVGDLAKRLAELSSREDWDAVIGYYGELVDQMRDEPGYWRAACYIARAYEKTSEPLFAEELYRKAMESDPRLRTPYIGLGRVLLDGGRVQEAILVLEKALETTDRDVDGPFQDSEEMWTWKLYDWLCTAHHRNGDYEEALKWGYLAQEGNPGDPRIARNVEELSKATGK